MTNRVVYLDVIRGFAILLVVIGHLIQYNYDCFLTNPIFNCIYSFHMPLFFFLSGYTVAIRDKTDEFNSTSTPNLVKEVISKTRHLLLPALTPCSRLGGYILYNQPCTTNGGNIIFMLLVFVCAMGYISLLELFIVYILFSREAYLVASILLFYCVDCICCRLQTNTSCIPLHVYIWIHLSCPNM